MTLDDIAHLRLVNQLLINGKTKTPGDVVARLGGIQAQDYAGGELSIGLRLPQATIFDIERSISEGKIVRTWAFRGTLHFLAADDIRWILELLSPILISRLNRRYSELGLDAATLRKTNSLLEKSLRGDKHLTRKELIAVIEKNGISCKGQRAVFILHRASLDRIICFGVTRGKQQTHALFDEWVPKTKQLTREESLAELAYRYFASHGPATIQDYMWWSGIRASDANTGLEMTRSKLEQVTIGGKTYWLPDNAARFAKSASPTVHLLPGFDDYLLGYKDRSASLAPKDAKKLSNGGGILKHTIVIDGTIVGIWSRTFKKDEVFIEGKFFRPLKKSEMAALNVAVERYGKLVTKSPTLHSG